MVGTQWGVAIAFDQSHRNARKWASIRNRSVAPKRGLSGEALERAVMAVAEMFPEQVVRS